MEQLFKIVVFCIVRVVFIFLSLFYFTCIQPSFTQAILKGNKCLATLNLVTDNYKLLLHEIEMVVVTIYE